MSEVYFHSAGRGLEPGDIVEPGNWWQVMLRYTPATHPNAWPVVQELLYEIVRGTDGRFGGKPSRMRSTYVCFTKRDLHAFQQRTERLHDHSYEVELVDPAAASHVGDWTLPIIQTDHGIERIKRRAAMYWEGGMINERELLTLSPLRVLAVL